MLKSVKPESSTSSNEKNRADPVAIIGFSLKFPQEAIDAEAFWELMLSGRCTATEYPEDRISTPGRYHPDPNRKDTFSVCGGHFIDDKVAAFDAPFFSISRTEAAALDPQQRGLLEVTYRALENAGLPLSKINGSQTSVYTGCFTNDWQQLCYKDSENSHTYAGLGSAACMNANRINWFFNFKGASANVDTACSSSLVALHLACQDLLNNEAEMAIAAGCNLIFSPDWIHLLSNMNMLSPDYRCYSFDSRANGYSRGEGFGVLILKRLSVAIRDGDTIRGIIRATGTNQDGFTSGITQPSSRAQEELIRQTYAKACLSMECTRFVEAHGTGTAVGDPIEASALGSAFRAARSLDDPLYVGALKANIGHLEGASGIAGVIKTLLVLENGIIPPNAGFQHLNPRIDDKFLKLKFPVNPTAWPTPGLRRASVNSFGFGGTNAHVILDDVYHYLLSHNLVASHNTLATVSSSLPIGHISTKATQNETGQGQMINDRELKLFVFSGNDNAAVRRVITMFKDFFNRVAISEDQIPEYLNNISYTLATKRTLLKWRTFIVTDSLENLRNLEVMSAPIMHSLETPIFGFIFTGQGAQWANMGVELLKFPVFRGIIEQAEIYLKGLGCLWSILEEIRRPAENSNIHKPQFSQPICTAIQIALVELLHNFNIYPRVVVGHSSGEIAAAYCLGALSLQSAFKIAYFRGFFAAKLQELKRPKGAMMAVGLSVEEIRKYLNQSRYHQVNIACFNSHRNVTLSGDETEMLDLKSILDSHGVFARKIAVDVAYHSPQMEEIALDYRNSINNLTEGVIHLKNCNMISTVTGEGVSRQQLCCADYWIENMTSPVQFHEAIKAICDQSIRHKWKKLDCSHRAHVCVDLLIEIGPHAALRGPIEETLTHISSQSIKYASMMTRYQSSEETVMQVAGIAHAFGCKISWESINSPIANLSTTMMLNLPEYPFDHSKTFWYETRISKRNRTHPQGKLDLLGRPSTDWNPLEAKWRNLIRVTDMAWVIDHIINGSLLYPAAGMLVMAIEAAKQMADPRYKILGYEFRDVVFQKALIIPQDDMGIETHFYVKQTSEGFNDSGHWMKFRLCTCEETKDGETWREHCNGLLRLDYSSRIPTRQNTTDFEELYQQTATGFELRIASNELYRTLKKAGYGFGPSFRSLHEITHNSNNQATARVKLYQWPEAEFPQAHVVHPASLDGMLHLCLVTLAQNFKNSMHTSVPSQIKRCWVANYGLNSTQSTYVSAVTTAKEITTRYSDFNGMVLSDANNQILMQTEGLRMTIVAAAQVPPLAENMCYQLIYEPDVDLLHDTNLKRYCTSLPHTAIEPQNFYQKLLFISYMFLANAEKSISNAKTEPRLPHLGKYIEWMKFQLKRYRDGILPHSQPGWEDLIGNKCYVDKIILEVETGTPQGRVFTTTGRNLVSILEGKIDAQELLFESNLINDLYMDINSNRSCFSGLDKYLDCLSYKRPIMQIIEIGAGTGGTTSRILRSLSVDNEGRQRESRYSSYTYTDISSFFFQNAQKKFENFPRLLYRTLNIESDLVSQGFEEGFYDLVIAANVLHATSDIKKTLENVRKLLKPGGKIILHEITRPEILRSGFVFGLLPGWWLSTEPFRKWGPAMSSVTWGNILSETSFSGIDLELEEYASGECHELSILISTAISRDSVVSPSPNITIIVNEASELQKNVAGSLRRKFAVQSLGDCQIVAMGADLCFSHRKFEKVFILLELEAPVIFSLSETTYLTIQSLLTSAADITWIRGGGGTGAQDPAWNMIEGLSRSIRNEDLERKIIVIALDMRPLAALNTNQLDTICEIGFQSSEYPPNEVEFVEIDSYFMIPRAIPATRLAREIHQRSLPQQPSTLLMSESPAIKLAIEIPGLLETLYFEQDTDYNVPLTPTEVEIQVKAIGLGKQDYQIALGQTPLTEFGNECSGIVTRCGRLCQGIAPGDEVLMIGIGLFRNLARRDFRTVCKIPAGMTFTEAASFSIRFLTAWEAVSRLGHIQRDETILIHESEQGTRHAAVQVAKYHGAEVFATTSTEAETNILVENYGIARDHIFEIRSNSSMPRMIINATTGRGVDVIVSSAMGEELATCWDCIAPNGRIVHLAQSDIQSRLKQELNAFRRNVSFTSFDVILWIRDELEKATQRLRVLLELINCTLFHMPPSLRVYSVENLEDVFQSIRDGEVPGNLIVELNPSHHINALLDTIHTTILDPDGTYVVSGGFGGVGRSIVRWLAAHGAKYLIVLSRSGASSQSANELLQELRLKGVRVHSTACDIVDAIALKRALSPTESAYPPVKGCIQSVMVLKDSSFANMSYGDWNLGTKCKAQGSWNLHSQLPENLDFFVMLSSTSGVVGIHGQANYGAGNCYMDALARYRVSIGQKAVVWDLGLMLDDGHFSEDEDLMRRIVAYETFAPITKRFTLALLDHYCDHKLGLLEPHESQIIVGLGVGMKVQSQAIFQHTIPHKASSATSTDPEDLVSDYRKLFAESLSMAEAGSIATKAIVEKLSRNLTGLRGKVDMDKPIHVLGVDSLLAIDLKSWIAREFMADFPVFEIQGGATLSSVGLLVARTSKIAHDLWTVAG